MTNHNEQFDPANVQLLDVYQMQSDGSLEHTDSVDLFGDGDGELAGRLLRPPANLVTGPFAWTIDSPL